jgi:hypothetical protein
MSDLKAEEYKSFKDIKRVKGVLPKNQPTPKKSIEEAQKE